MMRRGSSNSSASSSSTSSAVDGWPVAVRRFTGSASLPNSTSWSCFGESRLKLVPAAACAACSRVEQALRDLEALASEHVPVDQHTLVLHLDQHREEGPLDVLVHGLEPGQPDELGPEPLVQPDGDVRTLGRVLRRGVDRHLVERQLSCSPARDVVEPDRVDPEVTRRGRVEVVPRQGAVEHVGLEHRVVSHPGELDAVVAQHMRMELEMVSHLGARRILEQGLESGEHAPTIELRRCARIVVRERDVGGVPGLAGQGDTDDLGPHVVGRGRLHVDGHQRRVAQPLEPLFKRGRGQDRLVSSRNGLGAGYASRQWRASH